MTVLKKQTLTPVSEEKIEEFINKGGKVTSDNVVESKDEKHRLNLLFPADILKRIDEERDKRMVKISRTQWILEAIVEKLSK